VIHPEKITHLGIEYSLTHLVDGHGSFAWKTKNGRDVTFNVKTSYADHCYSDKDLPRQPGCHIVMSRGVERVFCTDRHSRSLSLPDLVNGLFTKPTQTVSFTAERNYALLYLMMKPPVTKGKRYYVFFHMKWHGSDTSADAFDVQLNVESAYQKSKTVEFKRLPTFGTVAEELVFGK